MTKRLAIIPARGRSKRIKNKNLKKFYNKPLIYYPIVAAKKSKIFDKIHISSDSSEILNFSKKFNLTVDFKRPKNLSNDKVGLYEVINFVVKKYENLNLNFDEIWMIYASNPFVSCSIIKDCKKEFKKIKNKPENSLMTVTKYNYPIKWAQKVNKNNQLTPLSKSSLIKRSQEMENTVCDAGMINVYSPDIFKKKLKRKYHPFHLPIYSSVDIDNYDDLEFAKKLFKK